MVEMKLVSYNGGDDVVNSDICDAERISIKNGTIRLILFHSSNGLLCITICFHLAYRTLNVVIIAMLVVMVIVIIIVVVLVLVVTIVMVVVMVRVIGLVVIMVML